MNIHQSGQIKFLQLRRKKKGSMFLLTLACLLMLLAGCSGKGDVTGKWNGKITLPETGKSLSDLQIELTQQDGQITGAINFVKADWVKVKLKGTRTGDELKFQSEDKRGLSVNFSGSVQSGSRITGTALLVYRDPRVPVKQERVTLELSRK